VSDTVVLIITALLLLGVLGCTIWGTWHISRSTPRRQHALSIVLGSTAGTALLGVVLPAVLMGAVDPFPIWLLYATLTVAAATTLGWRWQALPSEKRTKPALVATSSLLLIIITTAAVAVT
jgi:CDP-diglyceride synthetase